MYNLFFLVILSTNKYHHIIQKKLARTMVMDKYDHCNSYFAFSIED